MSDVNDYDPEVDFDAPEIDSNAESGTYIHTYIHEINSVCVQWCVCVRMRMREREMNTLKRTSMLLKSVPMLS